MNKRVLCLSLVLLMVILAVLPGCEQIGVISGMGPVVTRNYNLTDFTAIEASNAFQVDITQSATYSVVISANENLFDNLDISKSGSTLKIGTKGVSLTNATLKAAVTMPELWSLNLTGATKTNVKGFSSSHDLQLQVTGASTAALDNTAGNLKSTISGASKVTGRLKVNDAIFDVSGASNVELTGSAGKTTLGVSGASTLSLTNFTLGDTSVNLSGASHGAVTVNGKLDAVLSGASTLEYGGNVTLGNTNITGSSNLKKR